MIITGILKSKKNIILVQTIQIILFIISNLILGGIPGAIINAFGCIRNILYYKNLLKMRQKTIIILFGVIISLYFNNLGVIGLLPIISMIFYTSLMDIKSIKKFKLITTFSMCMWLIYDICIKSYSSAIFDIATIIANIIALSQLCKYNKQILNKR